MSKDKFRGAMVGLAIGDALGMPTEMMDYKKILSTYGHVNRFMNPLPGTPCSHLKAGQYTDDTQMAIRLAKAIIENKFVYSQNKVIQEFIKWYKEDDQRFPGGACVTACWGLMKNKKYKPHEETAGNGSAMRVTPIALFATNEEEMFDLAVKQSSITHGSEMAHDGSKIIAFCIKEMIDKGEIDYEKIFDFIKTFEMKDVLEYVFNTDTRIELDMETEFEAINDHIGTTGFVVDTVATVLYIVRKYGNNFEKAISYGAMVGGDTDTIAALIGTILGAKVGYENIPDKFLYQLENKNKLIEIADVLYYANNR